MSNEPRITGPVLKVLSFFLQAPTESAAGADIRRATKISTGTLYPLLLRLEQFNWLESKWEEVDPSEVGRPRKRLYRITRTGILHAEEELSSLTEWRPVWTG